MIQKKSEDLHPDKCTQRTLRQMLGNGINVFCSRLQEISPFNSFSYHHACFPQSFALLAPPWETAWPSYSICPGPCYGLILNLPPESQPGHCILTTKHSQQTEHLLSFD